MRVLLPLVEQVLGLGRICVEQKAVMARHEDGRLQWRAEHFVGIHCKGVRAGAPAHELLELGTVREQGGPAPRSVNVHPELVLLGNVRAGLEVVVGALDSAAVCRVKRIDFEE